ncbi:MAG: glycosyltransferase family 2 protein [Coriobacteriia bacterium]|nr:glycosyltransferase family 2 protein [Coriobacteriia bacterium]
MSESVPPCTGGADAVLIPVYNEATTVNDVLDAVLGEFDGTVIVVDDGSTDGTRDALKARDDIVLLEHGHNEGYGRTLADGFALARVRGVRRLVTIDCDRQHEPARIPALLQTLDETGVDIVSGSRYLPGSPVTGIAPFNRREINERVTAEVNDVTGWGISDAFCGFKAYCMDSLSKLELKEPGYAMPMELWARAYRAGLRVTEAPVERIYFDNDRTFGEDLDDPEKRFDYYMRVWTDALHGE